MPTGIYKRKIKRHWKVKDTSKMIGHTGVYIRTKEHKNKISLIKTGKSRPEISGEKNGRWIDGRSTEREKIRHSLEYKEWNKKVFIRDSFMCQKTRQKGKKLAAHHILNFSSHPELRFDINNGITLSREAHNEFHKIYGKVNNTQEQLNEFLKGTMVLYNI